MIAMLLAYDAAGTVVGTLDYVVQYADNGTRTPLGLVDFEAVELGGGELTDVWTVSNATGSKTWPEWLGGRAHEFRVELAGPPGRKHISALIHKASGHRRERASVEAAIAERRAQTPVGRPVDVRDIVGGPDRPLTLDEEGRSAGQPKVRQPQLPLVGLHRR